jgi:creatinine amidohydrolase
LNTRNEKVHYSELLPHEFEERLKQKPIAYLPLGTLEWHCYHLPLGSDAIQSEGLMVACAHEIGGIVLPPIHLGPDRALLDDNGRPYYGMDTLPEKEPLRQMIGSCYWVSPGFFKSLLDAILFQIKRVGFQAVFADGHGPSRWSWVRDIPEREERFGLKLFGVTKDIEDEWKYQIDHAALNETSIMLALRPELVDISRLPEDPSIPPERILGEDPRKAASNLGNEYLSSAVEIVKQMLVKAGF